MATGNGAYIVHKRIEEHIHNYEVIPYSPYRTFFPPFLTPLGRFSHAGLIHTTPDYAFFHARKSIPLIVTFHGYVLDRFMQDYSSVLQNIHCRTDLKIYIKLAVAMADVITAVSQFTANLVKQEMQLTNDRIRVIYNGIDLEFFKPQINQKKKRAKRINVLFSGKLTRRKGANWLIPIADKLNRNITVNYTSGLQISGNLANHPQLKCLGTVPYRDMPAVYQDADILLFPTVREGLPLAAVEAMSCGLPVVATNCSSLPELVDHGKGGFLCQLGHVNEFAEKINILSESPLLRHEMGEYNRSKIEEKFTLNRMIKQYRELFEEVFSNRR